MRNSNRKNLKKTRRNLKIFSALLVMVVLFQQGIPLQFINAAGGNTIYLSGSGGNDSASGASQEEAVRSLAKAKELTAGNGKILVCGTISVSGNTTWSLPGGVSLQRAPGFTAAIVNITGTLTLKNISLSSSDISGSGSIAGKEKETPTPEVTATPEPTPEVTATPEPTPEVTAAPEPTPEVTATPEPTPEETAAPEPTPGVTATPEATTAPTPESTEISKAGNAANPVSGKETGKEGISKTGDDKNIAVSSGSDKEKEEASDQKQTEQNKDVQPAKEEEKPIKVDELIALLQNLKVTVETQDDINAVVAVSKAYDMYSQEEKDAVPRELTMRIQKAQLACKMINRISNGISVDGDLPWYVQFRAEKGNSAGTGTFDLGELLGSYEMKLWNLLTDSSYKPNGPVTVTIPLSDASKYKDISIIHYLPNGGHEVLIPEILENAIRFTTTSFSPYNIAGNVLVGDVDKVYTKSESDSDKTSSGNSQQNNSGNKNSTSNSSTPGSASKTIKGTTTNNTRAVNTGDTTNIIPLICVGIGALLVIVILIIVLKKRNKK